MRDVGADIAAVGEIRSCQVFKLLVFLINDVGRVGLEGERQCHALVAFPIAFVAFCVELHYVLVVALNVDAVVGGGLPEYGLHQSQTNGWGLFAEGWLHSVIGGLAFLVDVHPDDHLPAIALLQIGFGIDEVLGDVVLGEGAARDGFWVFVLRVQLQSPKKDDEHEEYSCCFHGWNVLVGQK